MRAPYISFLLMLTAVGSNSHAQEDPFELTIVGSEGWGVKILHGGSGSLPPIVLKGDEVLYPGHLDCGLAQGHPQCRSLEILLGSEPQGQHPAPKAIIISPGGPAILLDIVTDYPPPLVIVQGCGVNRHAIGACHPGPNDVQVVDASGGIVLIDTMDGDSGAPFVRLNDEVLGAPGMDCEQTISGGWLCQLPGGGALFWWDPVTGPDSVFSGLESGVLVDFTVSDAPPPIVYKDGNVLNR